MYDTKAKEAVKSLAAELGFDLVGVTSADPFYEAEEITLERVRAGLMDGLPWFHAARVKRGLPSPGDTTRRTLHNRRGNELHGRGPTTDRRIDTSARQSGPLCVGAGLPQGYGASTEALCAKALGAPGASGAGQGVRGHRPHARSGRWPSAQASAGLERTPTSSLAVTALGCSWARSSPTWSWSLTRHRRRPAANAPSA